MPPVTLPSPGDRLAALVHGDGATPPRSGQVTVGLEGLSVTVAGIGSLSAPVTPTQVKKLIAQSAPAPFGQGEKTLHDPRVRDTWQVPTGAVTVDWAGAAEEVLAAVGTVLDVPDGARVAIELHSMLVYGKGQFFAPHQDSEKRDTMAATLVVTLAARHTGGELVVHESGGERVYRADAHTARAVALYSDVVHEVRPVRSGHRISLTFNVLVDQSEVTLPRDDTDEAVRLLRHHFYAPLRPRWSGEETGRPLRYVYLLDHEYTSAALSWRRLKGVDVAAAQTLRAAAERLGGQALLALTDIHEIHQTNENGWYAEEDDLDEEDDWDDDDDLDPEVGEVGELIGRSVVATHWLLPGTASSRKVHLAIDDRTVGAGRPTDEASPYAREYEGYMGNYGNTLDRWYHRAAVLVTPKGGAFASRAEADPSWALAELDRLLTEGDTAKAQANAASMVSFWASALAGEERPQLVAACLDVAAQVDSATAEVIVSPVTMTDLRPANASGLARLATAHGGPWVVARLAEARGHGWRRPIHSSAEWMADLPELTRRLRDHRDVAEMLAATAWSGLRPVVGTLTNADPRPSVAESLADLGAPVSLVLRACANAELSIVDEVVDTLTSEARALPLLSAVVRRADEWSDDEVARGRVVDLARQAVAWLREELDRQRRAADDWSMTPPSGCACAWCPALSEYLASPTERVRKWPLAQQGRDHLEARLRNSELPVTRKTLKQGRPYTLVLTKSPILFTREAARAAAAEGGLFAMDRLLARWA